MMRRRLPQSLYNPVSLVGAGAALLMLGAILVFFILDVSGASTSPYIGILTYMVLPGVLVLGLLVIPVGMWLEIRRRKKTGGAERKYFTIDLNQPAQRFAFMIFMVGTTFLVIISTVGMYQAYQYSESVTFCGEVCHTVMKPEYTAYQHSPHARVLCAECHIGEGADWFVKAKVSGMYQVYSVLFNKYSRPIETPIRNLRPARETCEHCHWPQKFSANLEMAKTYFPFDTAALPPWSVTLQLHIGGGQSELGPTTGIHWHMNTDNVVEYVATDDKRQVIPWVQIINARTGRRRTFKAVEAYDAKTVAAGEHRRMDCIDCHNRPSHIYHPPFRTLNDAMAQGRIASTLPNIRSIASYALVKEYATEAQALQEIPSVIRSQYETKMPDVARARSFEIDAAIREVSRMYQRNFFPEMNVSWRRYPNNVGHMYNDGCFRCHDNKHVAEDGTVLSNDCNLCHLIVAQGPRGALQTNLTGMPFRHPVDIGDAVTTEKCTTCHSGE
jgi:hypothetical protein